jgi:hypothetical protein
VQPLRQASFHHGQPALELCEPLLDRWPSNCSGKDPACQLVQRDALCGGQRFELIDQGAVEPEVQLLPIGHAGRINLPSVWQHLAGSAALATPLLAAMVGFGATTLALLGALADRFAVFSAGG